MNALSEKITFLWNFYHVFSVLFYEWNTSINDSFRFFLGFFLETALFNGAGEGACFSVGRRVSIKYRTGWRPHAHPPITTMGNPDISVNRKKFCLLDQPTSLDRSSHLYLCYFVCPFVRPSTRLPAHLLTFHDGGWYHIETSPLICRANQWTGFYIISASVMKRLKVY